MPTAVLLGREGAARMLIQHPRGALGTRRA